LIDFGIETGGGARERLETLPLGFRV